MFHVSDRQESTFQSALGVAESCAQKLQGEAAERQQQLEMAQSDLEQTQQGLANDLKDSPSTRGKFTATRREVQAVQQSLNMLRVEHTELCGAPGPNQAELERTRQSLQTSEQDNVRLSRDLAVERRYSEKLESKLAEKAHLFRDAEQKLAESATINSHYHDALLLLDAHCTHYGTTITRFEELVQDLEEDTMEAEKDGIMLARAVAELPTMKLRLDLVSSVEPFYGTRPHGTKRPLATDSPDEPTTDLAETRISKQQCNERSKSIRPPPVSNDALPPFSLEKLPYLRSILARRQ